MTELMQEVDAVQRRAERAKNRRAVALGIVGLLLMGAIFSNAWVNYQANQAQVRATRASSCIAKRIDFTVTRLLAAVDEHDFEIKTLIGRIARESGVVLPMKEKVLRPPPPPAEPRCKVPLREALRVRPSVMRNPEPDAPTQSTTEPATGTTEPPPREPEPEPEPQPDPEPKPDPSPKPEPGCIAVVLDQCVEDPT